MAPWCAPKEGVTPLRDGDKISRHLSQCDVPVVASARDHGAFFIGKSISAL
jgi:hypothetical protein